MHDCENCNERCQQAEMAHEIALGRMYATKELIKLVKKIESGQMVEVVRCRDCEVPHNKYTGCPMLNGLVTPHDFYCPFGERKDGDENGVEEK